MPCRPAAAFRRSARCCPPPGWRCLTWGHIGHAASRPHGPWIRRPRHHLPGRWHDAERHRGRRQRAELLQRDDVRGDQLSDERHQRRSLRGRRSCQHDSEGRWQRFQGHRVLLRRQQKSAIRQLGGRPQGRPRRARRLEQGVGLQPGRRRPDQEGSVVVLRVVSRLGRLPVHREQLLRQRRSDRRRCEHSQRSRPADDRRVTRLPAKRPTSAHPSSTTRPKASTPGR